LTDPDAINALVTITSVSVSFPLRRLAPRRHCSASTVKPATLLDVVITDQA